MLTELRLPYADTSAAALRWSSVRPDLPALDVLVVPGPAARLELLLLGSSHSAALHTRASSDALVETVACLHDGVGEPVPSARERSLGALHYRFASSVTRLDAPGLGDLARRLRREALDGRDVIAGVFPGDDDALTVLAGAVEPAAARWDTWHLYPNTGEAVRTTTEVTW
jgi:hypothetical protein